MDEEEVYRLVRLQSRLGKLLEKMPADAPERSEVETDLSGIKQELSNIKPGQLATLWNSFKSGEAFGQEGRAKGLWGELKEKMGGPESDYDARVEASDLYKAAGEKEHPWTSRIGEYGLPMINPLSPLQGLTSGIIRGGQKLLGKAATKGVPEGIGAITNAIEYKAGAEAAEAAAKNVAKEASIVEKGLEGAGKASVRNAIKDSMLRGGVSSTLVGLGSMKEDDSLADKTVGVLANTALGTAFGWAIPKGLNVAGSAIKGFGGLFNNKFGEVFSAMPDRMVKKSLANLFHWSPEDLKHIKPEEINYLRQYIELVNSKGSHVVGGNRPELIKFTQKLADELYDRNQNLINLSVDEGKSISLDALIKGVQSQFKAKSEKDLVAKTFEDFMPELGPSKLGISHEVPGMLSKTTPNFALEGETAKQTADRVAEELKGIAGMNLEKRMTAKDVYELQNHLSGYLKDYYKLGNNISGADAKHKRVLEKIVQAGSFAYKHLEPSASKGNKYLSLKENASEIRKLLTLQTHLEQSLSNQEAKVMQKSALKSGFYGGGLGYLAGHALTKVDPMVTGSLMAAAAGGGRAASNLMKGKFISDRLRSDIGTGLSGQVPIMMGGTAARPIAAGIDMYKTAGQASPPPVPEIEIPEEEEVPDFTGFGSSEEWIRSQLSK